MSYLDWWARCSADGSSRSSAYYAADSYIALLQLPLAPLCWCRSRGCLRAEGSDVVWHETLSRNLVMGPFPIIPSLGRDHQGDPANNISGRPVYRAPSMSETMRLYATAQGAVVLLEKV